MQIGVFLVAVAIAAQPAADVRRGTGQARLEKCVVSMIDHVQLPAQLAGVLIELTAKEGVIVRQGDVLARVDDTETKVRLKAAEAKRDVAQEKATNESEVQAAKKIIEVAKAEFEESTAINRRSPDTIPVTQVRRQQLQWERAVLEAAVAEMNFSVAKKELNVAEAEVEAVENELARRVIRAPFDGVVVQLYRQQSEWVQPGDPVVRVVRMDRLRVEGFLSADRYAPEQILGANVVIEVHLVEGRTAKLTGTVDHVSPLVEASGEYRIWSEIDNQPGGGDYQWLVRPGLEADMTIQLKTPTTSGPAPVRTSKF